MNNSDLGAHPPKNPGIFLEAIEDVINIGLERKDEVEALPNDLKGEGLEKIIELNEFLFNNTKDFAKNIFFFGMVDCKLEKFPSFIADLPNLHEVFLGNNNIEFIDQNCVEKLNKLNSFYIKNNRINQLPDGLTFEKAIKVDFSGNMLVESAIPQVLSENKKIDFTEQRTIEPKEATKLTKEAEKEPEYEPQI